MNIDYFFSSVVSELYFDHMTDVFTCSVWPPSSSSTSVPRTYKNIRGVGFECNLNVNSARMLNIYYLNVNLRERWYLHRIIKRTVFMNLCCEITKKILWKFKLRKTIRSFRLFSYVKKNSGRCPLRKFFCSKFQFYSPPRLTNLG